MDALMLTYYTLHGFDVLHNDVRDDNVRMSVNGPAFAVLLDFAFAKEIKYNSDGSSNGVRDFSAFVVILLAFRNV